MDDVAIDRHCAAAGGRQANGHPTNGHPLPRAQEAAIDGADLGDSGPRTADVRCAAGTSGGDPFGLSDVQHVLFHSPYNKLVQKSFARMVFCDARRLRRAGKRLPAEVEASVGRWLEVPLEVRALSLRPARLSSSRFCGRVD